MNLGIKLYNIDKPDDIYEVVKMNNASSFNFHCNINLQEWMLGGFKIIKSWNPP